MISERVSVEFIHGDALSLFYVSFCERAGRKGSALRSGRRVIFRRIFPEGSCKRWESVFSE